MIVLTLHRATPLRRDEIAALPQGCYPVMSAGTVVARAELDLPVAHMMRFAVEMIRAIPDADLEAEERSSAEAAALLSAHALTEPFRTWMPALQRQRLPSAAALSTMEAAPFVDPKPAYVPAPPEPTPLPMPVPEAVPEEEPPDSAAPADPPAPSVPARSISAPGLPPELASFMDTLLSTPATTTSPAAAPPVSPAPAAPVPRVPVVQPLPAPPAPSGPDPWALLDTGQREAAEDAFKVHTLTEADRSRIRALINASKPEHIALGCSISRLTKWRSAANLIVRKLFHLNPAVRLEAARALGTLAGPELEPALHMSLRDNDPDVRNAAKRALRQLQQRQS